MSPKLAREYLSDASYIECGIHEIEPDRWRKHGVRYRLVWVQKLRARVIFDNHHGKSDHYHIDREEFPYHFESIDQVMTDFRAAIKKLGGPT